MTTRASRGRLRTAVLLRLSDCGRETAGDDGVRLELAGSELRTGLVTDVGSVASANSGSTTGLAPKGLGMQLAGRDWGTRVMKGGGVEGPGWRARGAASGQGTG